MTIARRIALSLLALLALTTSAFAGRSVAIESLVVTVGGVEFARYSDSQADQEWLSTFKRSGEVRTVVLAGRAPDGRTIPSYTYSGCRVSHLSEKRGGANDEIASLTLACASAEAK